MALTPCPECGRQVSASAPACPGCGHPLKAGTGRDSGWLGKLAGVFGVWLLAPWAARVLVFIAACVVAVVALVSSR
ncbi:MAG: zinc-ribbon domain-containing protein [Comamonadaceae bacterium]|nr:MAG: zinc-ribbon domain-containing protein [Comamonadaceae bacterium]